MELRELSRKVANREHEGIRVTPQIERPSISIEGIPVKDKELQALVAILTEALAETKPHFTIDSMERKDHLRLRVIQAQLANANRNYHQAQQLVTEDDLNHARVAGWLSIESNVAEVLGDSSHGIQDWKAALQFYSRLRDLHPTSPVTNYVYADALQHLGRHREAASSFSETISTYVNAKENRFEADALRARAISLIALGLNEAAESDAARSIEILRKLRQRGDKSLNGSLALALAAKASAILQSGEAGRSLKCLNEAVDLLSRISDDDEFLATQYPSVLSLRALSFLLNGMFAEASMDCLAAVTASQTLSRLGVQFEAIRAESRAKLFSGIVSAETGDLEGSSASIDSSVSLYSQLLKNGRSEIKLELAMSLYIRSSLSGRTTPESVADLNRGITLLESEIASNPSAELLLAIFRYARVLFVDIHDTGEIDWIAEVLERWSTQNLQARVLLADIYALRAENAIHSEEAEKHFEEALNLLAISSAPMVAAERALLLLRRAETRFGRGDMQAAYDDTNVAVGVCNAFDSSALAFSATRARSLVTRAEFRDGNARKSVEDCTEALRILEPFGANTTILDVVAIRARSFAARATLCYEDTPEAAKKDRLASIQLYDALVEIDPSYLAESASNQTAHGDEFILSGNIKAAERAFCRAIEAYEKLPSYSNDPIGHGTALSRRGDTYQDSRAWSAAAVDYQKAIELFDSSFNKEPLAESLNNLSWLLSTAPIDKLRNGEEALHHAKRACDLTAWEIWEYWDTLAAGYAEVGDFESAIAWQKKVVNAAPHEFHEELSARLRTYESKKPHRQ